ncbi:hypothetical protein B0J14DRAFT_495265, partial [Halenospora varia]
LTKPLLFDKFIKPLDKVIEDDNGDIFQSVIEHHTAKQDGKEELIEPEEGDIEEESVPVSKAIKALETLRLYKIQ